MINIENEIFNDVSTKVRTSVEDVYMSGEYVKSPPHFPAVFLIEMDNTPVVATQTSTEMENHSTLMYEVNVYSNKKTGKKTECKKIITLIDEAMSALGFTRIMLQPIPNMDDATIYRMTARYRAVVSKDKVIYRR